MISVIVPVYNVEKYLDKCLQSLLDQTYKDLEVIMVDDGSKDNSGKICDKYAKQYENFKAIHKKNAGLGMARNTGMEYMTGEYVTFLDSDDYLDPDCIEKLYKSLLKNNVDMCKGGFQRVTDSGKVKLVRRYENQLFMHNEAKNELLPRMIGGMPSLHDSIEMCVCGALYNTNTIKKHNIKFPSERELISEDLVFNIDYMQYADGACTNENVGYNYRITTGSLTSSYRKDRFEACKHFYVTIQKKLIELGYNEITMMRLKKIFFIYLKMCIAQERKDISGRSKRESYESIKRICQDPIVREAIITYPINKLGFSQRAFLKLILKNNFKTLYLLFSIRENI